MRISTEKKTKNTNHKHQNLDKVAINVKSFKILRKILKENPYLEELMVEARSREEAINAIRTWVLAYFESNPVAYSYFKGELTGQESLNLLEWRDIAAIRLMDYVENSGLKLKDPNIKVRKETLNDPIKLLWMAIKTGTGGAKPAFFEDMLHLFRQFQGINKRKRPTEEEVKEWMTRHPSGLDPQLVLIRKHNRDRILKIFIKKIDKEEIKDNKFFFEKGLSQEEKLAVAQEWWKDKLFHLRFAIRSTDLLNEMLDYSLSPEKIKAFKSAEEVGIPIFINPYYLSLLNTRIHGFAAESDRTIRDYIMINEQLVDEFGGINAWEKEDLVLPGKPNAAGWLLPNEYNVHRRYPEVSILIPDTVGRACGGLCVSCQRMFDFQNGNLNFNLEKLKPKGTWPERLKYLIKYWEDDSQLRDILITGGDALMSSDKSLKQILDEVLAMAERKREANKFRKEGKKFAEMLKIRLGTRLPVYLPQRITPELTQILADFRTKAAEIGFQQFVIQTHFESAMEITPEVKEAVQRLLSAGWVVVNQLVFTAAASRRGHTAKLRQSLNKIGVLPYYTFSVKGFLENSHNFATNARAVQEAIEEKVIGNVPAAFLDRIKKLPLDAANVVENIRTIKSDLNIPFLATDRNVLNLPGVGKSLTYRVIGITRYGKRILEFDYDQTRPHSPIVSKMDKIKIIESKPIMEYLEQIEEMGENIREYDGIYGYSIGETEPRPPLFEYPEYDYKLTDEVTNFEMPEM
ncbi:MAG: KamA family protein [Bacteroidetes bacterium]|jgi:lysine 2,3-aminomutase|nr:KamA family protein [Bacteroidota bacterium]MBT5531365.1 KamA family protein [Cytophagia bacterium]MBT3421658.1 KamA family protein [Bacteroidota bacterium]MBT3799700.1 KamA family protein [Bacteroidota bacterium]MBT3932626.1 KamA family protein [Bacteroidota bacterium]